MQTGHPDQKLKNKDPVWVFLAEYSPNDWIGALDHADKPAAGPLFQAIHDLGILPDCLKKIERTLMEYARDAQTRLHPGIPEQAIEVRLFCQSKILQVGNFSPTLSDRNPGDAIETPSIAPPLDQKSSGGWGYFVIDRGAGPPQCSQHWVDLYLYREGR